MNLVFYSTCSTSYDGNTFHYFNTPLCKDKLLSVLNKNSELNITIVSQLPGMFLLDLTGTELVEKNEDVEYRIIDSNITADEISKIILEYNPDYAISVTGFFRPFDWQGIKDGQIGEILKENGVHVICNSIETQLLCFDKNLTQNFLEQNKFNVPKSISVDHQLYWAERNHPEVIENSYKENILFQLKKFNYPIIIKDSTGLSSFGMEVVTTFNQAKAFLNSKKNNGNKLIQELIEGKQFGMEVYGTPGNYLLSPVFEFSVNQYKITSPKQSVKIGPVTGIQYKINELQTEILRLCNLLKINGSAQIDLVFDGNKWFIIEINPRLSGMTNTVCECWNTNYFELFIETVKGSFEKLSESPVLSMKLPLIDSKNLKLFLSYDFIKQINQTQNEAAKQQRETGYCEIIFTGKNGLELQQNLDLLKKEFPQLIDEGFYVQANKLLKDI